MNTEQTTNTRSQSTLRFEQKNIFLFDNRYFEVDSLPNNSLTQTMFVGTILARHDDEVIPYDPALHGDKIIGIIAGEIKPQQQVSANICHSGHINQNHLYYDDNGDISQIIDINMSITGVPDLTVGDILRRMGFHLVNNVEHTKFEE